MADWKEQLTSDLVKAGQDNFGVESSDEAMEPISNAISKAIEDSGEGGGGGSSSEWKTALAAEKEEREAADSTLQQNIDSQASSVQKSLDGLSRDINGEANRAKAAEQSNAAALEEHTTDTSNPHAVTAEQVGAYTKADADALYETKADAESKTDTYGIMMKYVDSNTLQFYRPSTVVIPDPIYELPLTNFTGSNRITTPYAILDEDGSTGTGAMDKWTLFFNITACSGNQRLLNCPSQYAKTSTASDKVIALCGGRWNGSNAYLVGYYWVGPTSGYFIGVVQSGQGSLQGCGKAAYRRDSSKSQCLQYTIDGKYWYDLKTEVSDLSRYSAPYLTIGGANNNYGKGTISVKLWDEALDDISSLFK